MDSVGCGANAYVYQAVTIFFRSFVAMPCACGAVAPRQHPTRDRRRCAGVVVAYWRVGIDRLGGAVRLERLRFSLNPLPEIFHEEPFGPFIHIGVIYGHALNFVNP